MATGVHTFWGPNIPLPTTGSPLHTTPGPFGQVGADGGGLQGGRVPSEGQSQSPFGFGPGTSRPGELTPGTPTFPGDQGTRLPVGAAPDWTRQGFLPPNLLAPFYNQAAVAGNLGTQTGFLTGPAGQFMAGLFDPNVNQMESAFLQAGLGNSRKLLEQGMARQEGQYEGTPFHSALPRAQGEVMNQFARDATQSASQLALNRQGLGAQLAQFPYQFTAEMAGVGSSVAERMFNLANTAFNAPYQIPLNVYSQLPFATPALIQSGGGGGGKGLL